MSWLKRLMRSDEGFTVVEFVIAAVILFIVSTGVLGAMAYASTASAATAMRELGLEVANQRMEIARNLPYDSLGVQSADANGAIISPETVSASGKSFLVVTTVDYVLDYTNDPVYGEEQSKNVRITVSWTTPRPGSVTVDSNVIGASTITNSGTVIINVHDVDTAANVPGASITIRPAVGSALTKTTSSTGLVRWGKIPSGSISMTGTCSTHYLDFSNIVNPTVIADKKPPNEWTVDAIRASSGTVHVTDQSGANLPNVRVTISNASLPAYSDWSAPNGTGSAISDANGNAFFPKLRKGSYAVTGVGLGNLSSYTVEASPPSLMILVGGTSSDKSELRMNSPTTIKVNVIDKVTRAAINGATVTATGVTFASQTGVGGVNGETISNNMGAIGATPKTYVVTATASGYSTIGNTATTTSMVQYTQGTATIELAPPTTIKVTVIDKVTRAVINGATVTGPTGVTFALQTGAGGVNGVSVSNDMGPTGTTPLTYSVAATRSGYSTTGNTATTTSMAQYTQGTATIELTPLSTTVKVTVQENCTNVRYVEGATVTAPGITFGSEVSPGVWIGNYTGAFPASSITVTVAKTGWVTKTGTVTPVQAQETAITIKPKATLQVTYTPGTYPITIYVYKQVGGAAPAVGALPSYQVLMNSAGDSPASFGLAAGTYYVSRKNTYKPSGFTPVTVTVTAGATKDQAITSTN